jgi:hypothetical protein
MSPASATSFSLLTTATLSRLNQVRVKVILRPTVSRSVCLGVKPRLGPKARFLLLSDSCDFVHVGVPLDERTGLSFINAAGPRQRSPSRIRVPWTHDRILLRSGLRLPQPGGLGPRIYIPQKEGGPVIPQALGSIFVASYYLQGCGGDIESTSTRGIQQMNY